MKNAITATLLAAALTLGSCTNEAIDDASGSRTGKVTLRFTPADDTTDAVNTPQSRTEFGDNYVIRWIESADHVGVFVRSAVPTDNADAVAKRDAPGAEIYFETQVNAYEDNAPLYAYYPYSAAAAANAAAVPLTIPAGQTQAVSGKYDGSSNPLVAVPVRLAAGAAGTLTQPIRFRPLGAMAEFDIFDESADGAHSGETILSVTFAAAGGELLAGTFAYDLTGVTEQGIPQPIDKSTIAAGSGSSSVTVSLDGSAQALTGSTAGSNLLYMTLLPGTCTGNLYVRTDRATYAYENRTVEFSRAWVKRFKLALDRADKVTRNIRTAADWAAFAAAANAEDCSEWEDPASGEVNLTADISTAAQFARIQKDWNGSFNGNGHTMTQGASTVPLFTVIGEQGRVGNLRLAGNLSEASSPTGTGTAAVAWINYGTISGVTNGIDIALTGISKSCIISGMVVRNAGIMEECEQQGNIDAAYDIASNINTFVGGVACFASDEAALHTGSFVRCKNTGAIRITKTGSKEYNLGKFAVGGICALVETGTADDYTLFESCENHGAIYRRDLTQGSNMAACVGGIVGRVCTSDGQSLDLSTGHYVRIENCRNYGAVENACYLVNGMANGTNTGERLAYAGGIAGAAIGTQALHAEITGCTNTGEIRGGQAIRACVLGGIAGLAGYTSIGNSVSDTRFRDTEAASSPGIGAIGSLAGYVRFDTTFDACSSYADISVSNAFQVGFCTGGVYKPATGAPTATITGSKFGGSLVNGSKNIDITAANFSSYLSGFGATAQEGNSFWSDHQ